MFYRKITEQLRKWKSNPQRAPLIIQGLRQVGKTTVAIAFGNEHYDNVFYVDFRKQIDAHAIFDCDFDIDVVAFALSTLGKRANMWDQDNCRDSETTFSFCGNC